VFFTAEHAEDAENGTNWVTTKREGVLMAAVCCYPGLGFLCGLCDLCVEMAL
jgi:hypothetical protein